MQRPKLVKGAPKGWLFLVFVSLLRLVENGRDNSTHTHSGTPRDCLLRESDDADEKSRYFLAAGHTTEKDEGTIKYQVKKEGQTTTAFSILFFFFNSSLSFFLSRITKCLHGRQGQTLSPWRLSRR